SHSDAQTDVRRQAGCVALARERRFQLLRLHRPLLGRARQKQEEFVASPANHVVRLPDLPLQQGAEGAEDLISRVVAESVMQMLESIEVDEHHAERLAVAAMTFQFAAANLVEEAPVV